MMNTWRSMVLGAILTMGAVSIGASPTSAQDPTTVESEPFTCEVSDTEVTWTSTDAKRYYVRRDAGSGDRYLGSSAGLSYDTSGRFGTFTVISYTGGRQQTQCDGTEGATVPTFACTVDDGVLSWTDQDAARYFVRRVVGDTNEYFDSALGTRMTVPTAGSYQVVTWNRGVRTSTHCFDPRSGSCEIERRNIRTAVEATSIENDGVYPTTIDELGNYFETPSERFGLEVVGNGLAPLVVAIEGGPCDY